MRDLIALLRDHGIQPTPQRLAVANYILTTRSHPTAEEVWAQVLASCPTVSRATVYNTLNLLADKGLVRVRQLRNGIAVFDGQMQPHHHLIDEDTGEVIDLPWEAFAVTPQSGLSDYEILEYHVVLKGRKKDRSATHPLPEVGTPASSDKP